MTDQLFILPDEDGYHAIYSYPPKQVIYFVRNGTCGICGAAMNQGKPVTGSPCTIGLYCQNGCIEYYSTDVDTI